MSDEWQAKKHQEPSAPRPLVTRHSSHATLDYQWDAAGSRGARRLQRIAVRAANAKESKTAIPHRKTWGSRDRRTK